MKNKAGNTFILVGLLLIAAALFLIGYNKLNDYCAGNLSDEAVQEMIPAIEDNKKQQERIESAGEQVIPDYILNPDMEMTTDLIDGNAYVGIISIPDIAVVLPVIENWSYPNLKISPCRYAGTVYKNDFVICAHNYETHFGNLKYLNVGSEIFFTDVEGNEFRYEVAEVETLQPTAIEEMTAGDWDLTLFTCTFGGAARVTVRCVLQENEL